MRVRALLLSLALSSGTAVVVPAGTAAAAPVRAERERPAVVEKRVIGRSVQGRPIVAWRLGRPGKRRVVLISSMHGNEPHTRQILWSLRDGRRLKGVDLWVVPTYNPDGIARRTRHNARGVDLNLSLIHI